MVPRYVIRSDRYGAADLDEALGGELEITEVGSVDDLLDGAPDREPGWILLPPDSAPEVVLDLIVRVAALDGGWSPLLLVDDEAGLSAVPIGPGFRESFREVLGRMNGEGVAPGLASFRICLRELSRIRHDMNNPLTAALAEVQLVLMDVEPGSEVASALNTVEAQLRRIRDMIGELTALRSPQR